MKRINYVIILICMALFASWIAFYIDLNNQVEYEANHPRLPIQNNATSEDGFYFSNVSIEPMTRFVLKTQDNDKNVMFVVKSAEDFDYTNSTVEINMSYIKQIRQENNTIIISIRK